MEHDEEYLASLHNRPTEYLPDRSRTVVTENDSPDVGFRYSINPYRGCSHGCSYCYARQTHEYLGFSAGQHMTRKQSKCTHDLLIWDEDQRIPTKLHAPVPARTVLCLKCGLGLAFKL